MFRTVLRLLTKIGSQTDALATQSRVAQVERDTAELLLAVGPLDGLEKRLRARSADLEQRRI